MKFKKIMLVTFVLLAILTLGAVSAADDVASDGLAVNDVEGDLNNVQTPSDYEIIEDDGDGNSELASDEWEPDTLDLNWDDEINRSDDDAIIGYAVDGPYKGNVVILNKDEQVILNVTLSEDENDWNDGEFVLCVKDLNLTTVSDGDVVTALLNVVGEDNPVNINKYFIYLTDTTIKFNPTKFRADVFQHYALTNNNAIVSVYCPEGSSGNVTVYVRKGDGDAIQYSKEVSQNIDNWLKWNIHDLGMDSMDEYFITVEANDTILEKGVRVEIVNPIYFNNEASYIDSTDFDRISILEVGVSSEVTGGRIIITYNGEEIFNKTLADFSNDGSISDLIWFNPSQGPGTEDETIKLYRVNNNNLNYEFEEGTYELTVTLIYEGSEPIENIENVTLAKVNTVTEGDYGIAIYDAQEYELGDEGCYLAKITVPEGADGFIKITVADNEWSGQYNLSDLDDDEGVYLIYPNFEGLDEGEYNVTIAYYENDEKIIENSAILNFFIFGEGPNDDDADDGVLIMVPNGDEAEYNIDEDMDAVFASVSVSNELNGNITISIYMDEDEPVEIVFFNKNLSEITNKEEDPDLEDFTIYNIALSDLGGFDAFLEYAYFEIAFISDDEECVDCRDYDIEIDEDNDNIIRFWECGDDDEMHGEGEEIDAEFTNANILNNDPVVTISKDDIPEDVDNEFTVIIPQEDDDPMEIPLKLDEILEGDNYVIRVNDLNIPEFKESFGILMIVQFYTEGEESYYAEWMDEDEAIHIYESPCIFDEISLLNEDDVITIQEIPGGVDEFTVTISKEGSDDIVKTFKFSEFDIDEEEVWVAFKLEDLGITEIGEYTVTVKYSEDLTYSGNLNVTRNVDIRGPDEDDEGEPVTYTSVDERVVNFRISENVKGYVKVYVNGVQVGENLNLTDLPMGSHPPHDGRLIVLNVLNIAESDEYNVKVELYSDADELLGDDEFNIKVEVGENSAQINEGSYAYGTEANDEIIEYTIGAPLLEGQYFNIYFNGVKAGNITANGMEFNDLFTVQMFDVKLFKPGTYNVNVTFFDGETETDLANGTISINELTLTSNKEVYILDEDYVIISFNMSSVADNARLDAYYVYDWGPVGRADSMVFNPYFGDQLKDELYDDGVISFDVAWITDEDGIDHFRLDEGTTLIYVTYNNGNGQELGGFITVNVTKVTPVDPNFNITIENVEEGTPIVVSVSANENFTGDVVVKVDGKDVLVRVTNGIGKNSTTGVVLSAKDNYEATIDFAANDVFNAGNAQTTFNVIAKASSGSNASANATSAQNTTQETPATPTTPETPAQKDTIKLVLKTVKVKKSAKKLILQATLKVNGKAVNKKLIVFKFNGKTYKAKTNKKGIAKVTVKKAVLKKLKVGKKVKYQAKYSTKTVKKTAKVKK